MKKKFRGLNPAKNAKERWALTEQMLSTAMKLHIIAQLESRGGLLLGAIVSIVLRHISPRRLLPNPGNLPLVLDVLCVS